MATASSISPRRQLKGDKRDRTRIKLLEAAQSLIRENGNSRTTLEDIAERAGMTTGAIYGNFKSRDELFQALGQAYWPPIKPRIKLGASFPEILRALADATIAAIPDRRVAAVGRMTELACTLNNDKIRTQMAVVTAQNYTIGEQWLRSVTREEDLPMPASQLVRVFHALIEGLVFQRLLTPELVPDEVFHSAFAAFANPANRRPDTANETKKPE